MHTSAHKDKIPAHIAIIMDGNGRWAQARHRPRGFGHQEGIKSVRQVVRRSAEIGVQALTLFAFSEENWGRPATEVKQLMRLFVHALRKEVAQLHKNHVRLKFIGDLSRFSADLQELMATSSSMTQHNSGLVLTIAINYSGRWDILQATRQIATQVANAHLPLSALNEQTIAAYFCLADLPPPDLFIRTGGEKRISNFLLWQIAYTELLFSDSLWPDFDASCLDAAVAEFSTRERRFGKISPQGIP